jgi:hypothetical protein
MHHLDRDRPDEAAKPRRQLSSFAGGSVTAMPAPAEPHQVADIWDPTGRVSSMNGLHGDD